MAFSLFGKNADHADARYRSRSSSLSANADLLRSRFGAAEEEEGDEEIRREGRDIYSISGATSELMNRRISIFLLCPKFIRRPSLYPVALR